VGTAGEAVEEVCLALVEGVVMCLVVRHSIMDHGADKAVEILVRSFLVAVVQSFSESMGMLPVIPPSNRVFLKGQFSSIHQVHLLALHLVPLIRRNVRMQNTRSPQAVMR